MYTCKKCGEPIEWRQINTNNGLRWLPFDYGTDTSHFETCPYAQEFKGTGTTTPKKDDQVKGSLDVFMWGD